MLPVCWRQSTVIQGYKHRLLPTRSAHAQSQRPTNHRPPVLPAPPTGTRNGLRGRVEGGKAGKGGRTERGAKKTGVFVTALPSLRVGIGLSDTRLGVGSLHYLHCLLLFIITAFCLEEEKRKDKENMAKWGYGPTNGPDTWEVNFPAARGERQSPINIDTAKVTYDKTLADNPLKINYQPEKNMCVQNNGHSVKCDCAEISILSGGPLGNNVYRLIQFHLHWGSEDNKGAEHTIDGKVYAAELHLVHWNSTKYKSFEEAVDKPDGLAVLCIFIKVGAPHPGFEAVSCQLSNVTGKGKKCSCPADFDPSTLLPKDTKRFWTYPGSLTTPPCYESVQFILFQEVAEFSPNQLKALRSLKFSEDENMVNNFRPPCYIGSRKVRASFQN